MRRPLALALLATVVGASLAGACGGDDDGVEAGGTATTQPAATTTAAPSPTTTTAPEPPPTTAAPCPPPGAPPASPFTGGDPASYGLLTDVSVASEKCTDRVAFAFDHALPGYRVEYQTGPFTQDASGAPVTIAGDAFVVIRFEPAYGYDFETGALTYEGPREIVPSSARFVREVENSGDFEAVLTWIVGVAPATPLAVEAGGQTLTLTFG